MISQNPIVNVGSVGFCLMLCLVGIVSGNVADVESQSEPNEPNGLLSLGDVFALILVQNPSLSAYTYEVRAQEALALQSNLRPNPELEVGVEDFGGTGATKGFDGAETTIQISQLIELADKRAKRSQIAKLDTELADWDYQSRRLDVFSEAATAYINVLACQERVALAEQLHRLTSEVKYAVSQRVAAGKESPLEETKAQVSFSASQIALENAHRSLETSRIQLASYWGSVTPAFAGLRGDIYKIKPHDGIETFAARIADNPDVARWATEVNQKQANLAHEKAKGVSDITVSAGTKYLNEPDDTVFVVGVTIPLPLFDNNRGNIRAAGERLRKARQLARQSSLEARAGLINAYQSLLSAYEQAVNLRDIIIPASQQAFNAAQEGYSYGKFGYLDLLDAQRTFFQARQQYIDMLVLYHQTHTTLQRLTGGKYDFDSFSIQQETKP